MLRQIQQVLRLLMILGKQRQQRGLKTAGGLLCLLWTEKGAAIQSLNCTIAAAGPWCTGIKMEELQPVLTDGGSMFPCVWPCPQPDPEELCNFTDLYGSLRFLLTFQMKDARLVSPEWCAHIEAFLHTFSLTNAGIRIHLKLKFSQQTFQREFRVKIKNKIAWANLPSLILDVTSSTQPLELVKRGCWCLGGHPVCGQRLPLSIPPEAMDQGLFGILSIQPVTILSPCVLQYPNLAAKLTHIQGMWFSWLHGTVTTTGTVLEPIVKAAGLRINSAKTEAMALPSDWDPSNVPFTDPSTFFQKLPAHLDCQELGLQRLHCSSFKDIVHSGGTLYTLAEEHCKDSDQETSFPSMQQSLLLLLFLQHSDPFTYQLSEIMATEALIEHHLENILNNNRQAVTAALQTELKDSLKAQNRREKDQEKLRSAAEVILSSAISIVSCSSNVDFRISCLNSMKVRDTYELSASLRESLRRVTSWKFIPKGQCYSAQREEHHESDEPTRTEI